MSSLKKKFIMALTGLLLFGFVIVHMLGNLQIFLGPEAINLYAYKLHSLPPIVIWGARLGLLAILIVHVLVAIRLTIENKKARPEKYDAEDTVQASYASRTMPMTGLIVFFFIVFHVLHYTSRVIPGMEYDEKLAPTTISIDGKSVETFDVYNMMITGFSSGWVSLFYIVAMALLCMHLAHGLSSLFQSLGLRNKIWRIRLDLVARIVAVLIFLGFASIPFAVITGNLNAKTCSSCCPSPMPTMQSCPADCSKPCCTLEMKQCPADCKKECCQGKESKNY